MNLLRLDRRARRLLALALLGALLTAPGCAGGTAGRVPPAPSPRDGLGLLPAPSTLTLASAAGGQSAAPRSSSYTEADVQQNGSSYDPALPDNLVVPGIVPAEFSSTWVSAAASSLADVAYCTYHFSLPGFDRNPQVRLQWSTAPQISSDCSVALANWDADRWDWYGVSGLFRAELPALEPYLDPTGDLLLVVASTAPLTVHLQTVRIGGVPPLPQLSASPGYGGLPLAVMLDAGSSLPVVGALAKFEWDIDGDGSFEIDGGTTPTYDAVFSTPGAKHPAVRVTNGDGCPATVAATVYAVAPWSHSWGLGGLDYINDCAMGADGMLYAIGNVQAGSSQMLLTKWNPLGELQWARSFADTGGQGCFGSGICVVGADEVYVAGQVHLGGSYEMLLQRWNSSGQLQYSKHWGGAFYDFLNAVVSDGTAVYVAGTRNSSDSDADLYCASLTPAGALNWSRYRDVAQYDNQTGLALRQDPSLGTTGVVLMGGALSGSFNTVWKVEYDTGGNFETSRQLGSPTQHKGGGGLLRVAPPMGPVRYYITGLLIVSGESHLFVSATDATGANVWGALSTGSYDVEASITDLVANGPDSLALSVLDFVGASRYVRLLSFATGDGSFLAQEDFATAAGATSAYNLDSLFGGLLLTGQAPDNGGSWSTGSAGFEPLVMSFSDLASSGGDPGYTLSDASGTVTDITADGTLDTGAGESDGWISWRPAL